MKNHTSKDCLHDVCHYCQKNGHLQSVLLSERKQDTGVRCLLQLDTVKTVGRSIPPLYQQVKLDGHKVNSEIEIGANNIVCNKNTWINIGKLKLQPVEAHYKVANGNQLQVLGQFQVTGQLHYKAKGIHVDLKVVVTNMPELNLPGRQANRLTYLNGHFMQHMDRPKKLSVAQLTM